MIEIKRKEDCVGCTSCVERCPVQCISFEADEQGFRYPKVDISRCVNCSICEKVCPVINKGEEKEPLAVYAAMNSDSQVVMTSSSGGVFFALAKSVIEEGGVVFGARFDEEYNVIHSYTETLDGIRAFQGSKYVQSYVGQSYKQAEEFLKQGRKVLFSGTPCQISGLRLFLRKDYGDLLLKVDVICHGVPSPLVWTNYLQDQVEDRALIKNLTFRDKRHGWVNYGFAYFIIKKEKKQECFEQMRQNVYMQSFLRDLTLRPSCFECPAKAGRSGSDITLGDFWGVKSLVPEYANSNGTSLVIVQSGFSKREIENLRTLKLGETSYYIATKSNPSLIYSAKKPKLYNSFWESYIRYQSNFILFQFIKKAKGPVILRMTRFICHLPQRAIKKILRTLKIKR